MSGIFDKHGYVAYPTTIEIFARQLIKVIDDSQKRTISNNELEEIIMFYVTNNSGKLFTEDELNITVKRMLGKRRIHVLNTILEQLDN